MDQVKVALDLAIKLYFVRANRLLNEQADNLRAHVPVKGVVLSPPSNEELNTIMSALAAARDEGISDAWRVASSYTDHGVTKAGSALRKQADEISDGISALKSSSLSVAV